MSKLPKAHVFFDLSDYGRPVARVIANALKETAVTPVQVTVGFIISGLIAIVCILFGYLRAAAFFLILKSVLDAADGELARVKNTPSYTGRYFDSVADIVLNLLIFTTIWYVADTGPVSAVLAFAAVQLQGTLYNYYYVILRTRFAGDTTSRIFEDSAPLAMQGENQKTVNVLFTLYSLFYGVFDKIISILDSNAPACRYFPNWFMTAVSSLGLGFQLLIISAMLALGWQDYINSFFISYSLVMFALIGIRKLL